MIANFQDQFTTCYSGDWIEVLKSLSDESVNCCVTSPPYWGLRDYKHEGQLGLEKTPMEYVSKLVAGFREIKRVLRRDGTCWINIGDCWASSTAPGCANKKGRNGNLGKHSYNSGVPQEAPNRSHVEGLKQKDLVGIPWRVAFALQDDGWYLRSDIIWHKPNPMPESVTDRPTKAHEYIFLLSRSPKYFYDHEAIKEPPSPELIKQIEDGYSGSATKDFGSNGVQDASATKSRIIGGYRKRIDKQRGHSRRHAGFNDRWDHLSVKEQAMCGRNKRSVWTVAPANYKEAHFATYPPNLIRPCILAGCPSGGTVLDPFAGSGTTGEVAIELGRKAILCELNPDYLPMIRQRTMQPGFFLDTSK